MTAEERLEWARKVGIARNEKLTAAQRSEIARKASQTRWQAVAAKKRAATAVDVRSPGQLGSDNSLDFHPGAAKANLIASPPEKIPSKASVVDSLTEEIPSKASVVDSLTEQILQLVDTKLQGWPEQNRAFCRQSLIDALSRPHLVSWTYGVFREIDALLERNGQVRSKVEVNVLTSLRNANKT
jgi:hypothetical protein